VGVPTHPTPSAHIQKGDILVAMYKKYNNERLNTVVSIPKLEVHGSN
jgi:hypothetical protein